MSFVAFAATVGGGSALLGGAMIGAGIGGAYSAVTGDGDILNSMLTGGLIGGAGAYGLGAMGVGAGGATGATSVGINAGTAAGTAAKGIGIAAPAAGSTFGALSAGAAPVAGATLTPAASSILGATGAGSAATGLTGTQMLGYGLAGSSALSLLGNQNRTSAGGSPEEDEYDRRLKGYRISPNYKAYEAQRPSPYYKPTYAADGGVMNLFDDEAGMDMAGGGMTSLGGYSDGGRMLKGPGDGMSDSIPGVIGGKQPARLADGEFVVPADVVSHLGNGSTDAGAKRLYSMMDDIRKARTGRKKQAPEINADKYLPTNKKASGGIASIPGYASGGTVGYATGGEVAALYESVLGRPADAAGAAYWANSGLSTAEIAKALAASPEGRTNQVKQIFNEQLGREAEQTALDFYSKALESGQSFADVSKGIAQAKEGQDLDKQSITSVYRQALGRNPEPAGQQYWLSVAQKEGLTANQLRDRITAAAGKERTDRNIEAGKKFENLDLAALESDPYGGYYSDKSIYDVAPDAENVSMIDGRRVQFTTPVTRQAVVSKFIDGVYTTTPGVDIINEPHIQAAINAARANGTLTETAFNNIVNSLKPVNGVPKTAAETKAILATPQARVIVDNIYGQQIGEDANITKARQEADQRQGVLNANDTGYYQSNRVLSDAYKAAGYTVPFDYGAYQGVDTRDVTKDVVTPQNLAQKQNSLLNSLNRNNPYRVNYQPINRGIANMPASVQDPYSDAGLQFLYGQMMNQYAPPPPGQVNPATFVPNSPYTYTPPPVNNLVLNTPIPDAANPAPAPTPANTGFFTAPNGQIFATEAAYQASVPAPSPNKAGGLLSIDRKKLAKNKPRKGLSAA